MPAMKKMRFLIFISILSLLLSACSQRVDYYFKPDGTWKIKSMIDYDPRTTIFVSEMVQFILGESTGMNLQSLPDEISGEMIESVLSVMFSTINLDGVQVSVNQGISTKTRQQIIFILLGNQLDLINTLAPGYLSLEEVEPEVYRFKMVMMDLGTIEGFDLSYLNALTKTTIVIRAGQILDSNADRQTLGQATWNNPREIDVTFKLKPLFPAWLLWILGLLTMVFLLSRLFRGGGRRCASCGAKLSKHDEYCAECGAFR